MGSFSIKNQWKIYAKIDTEKVMKIDEISMWNLSYIFILSEEGVHEKTYFSKKVNVRKPYESCSRMRVSEGSPKKKEIEQMRKHFNNTFKNRFR